MNDQLILDLPLPCALGRDSFVVSPANALALAALEGWRDWPEGKAILIGPEASGKSHLARLWGDLAAAGIVQAGALLREEIPDLARHPLVIEDADQLTQHAEQEALLHLHNLMAERGHALLVTARRPPRDWPLHLPDVASRMQASPLLRLGAPDDALLRGVMEKLFRDRQVTVPSHIIDWLAARMTRSLATAHRVVRDLDAKSLAEMQPISRQMAADWLERDLQIDLDL